MHRIVALLVVLATIVVNVFALSEMLSDLGLSDIAWNPPFLDAGRLYVSFADKTVAALFDFALKRFNLTPPHWVVHAVIAYASTACAVGAGRLTISQYEGLAEQAKSSGFAVLWPVAFLSFFIRSFQNRVVTRFAHEHSIVSVTYVATIAAVYLVSTSINERLARHPGIIPDTLSSSIDALNIPGKIAP